MQVVGDELVEPLGWMVGDIEEDGAVALLRTAANQLQCLLVALKQRRQERSDKGLRKNLGQRHLSKQRNKARAKRGILAGLNDERKLHGRSCHLNG